MSAQPISAVIFDIGGVLVDWNPRHLYRKLFPGDEDAMERFLADICSPAWNREMDGGRPFSDAVDSLVREHPAESSLIHAYFDRWPEMLDGPIPGTHELLGQLNDRGMRLFALSNFSAETFPLAKRMLPGFALFEDILISAEARAAKPDRAIFEHAIRRFGIVPEQSFFVDDSAENVAAAMACGFQAELFTGVADLRSRLQLLGIL